MRKASLGSNPLQESLLPGVHEPAALFGDTAQAADSVRLAGQYERLESIMADGFWHTLPQLTTDLYRRFGRRYSETSVSARLRQMRSRGWQIECVRTRAGSGLFQYRAIRSKEAA